MVLEGEVSGIGLINLIRQGNERIRDIPILAVSGWNDLLRQVYVLKHGAGDFIAKPFNETDFLARAINLIMSKRVRDELLAQQAALYQKVNIDSVTGINNRHFLDEYGENLVQSAITKNESIALMILDIDQFKEINDKTGHSAGDTMLKTVASILKNNGHINDIIARYGGDEFVVIIKDLNNQEVLQRAETIRQQVAEAKPLGIAVTCSIGLACHDKKIALQLVELLKNLNKTPENIELNYQTLFKAADHSLYAAKKAGRNQVCINNLLESEQK
mgnify:CR=1 FL=1